VPDAGIYLAEVQGEGVLLDLPGDRYVGLGATSTRLWRDLAAGATVDAVAEAVAAERSIDPETAKALVALQVDHWRDAGLLRGPDPRLPSARSPAPPASEVLCDDDVAEAPIQLAAIVAIAGSALWVAVSLAFRGPTATVAALQALDASDADWRSAIPIRRAQLALRRWVLQGRSDCWPRSLVLVRALRGRGVDARLCLGVRKFPFLAHAWVELGGVAIGEPPELLARLVSIARF
jgi:hypothetical protein